MIPLVIRSLRPERVSTLTLPNLPLDYPCNALQLLQPLSMQTQDLGRTMRVFYDLYTLHIWEAADEFHQLVMDRQLTDTGESSAFPPEPFRDGIDVSGA